MFAMVDCNNFYASCERLFQPCLRDKPIVVLSNNDGCVIARSNEAKALGIAMGVPFHQVRGLCQRHKVAVFSSNYTLYGDMSQRVMTVIEQHWSAVEIYSIDEAFLNLTGLSLLQADAFCQQLQATIFKQTGIPVSIGIGRSKTLAKLANHIAKKKLRVSVFNIDGQMHWLEQIAIQDIWGVGQRWAAKLIALGITTAADLAKLDTEFVRRRFNVVMLRTVLELNGRACIELEDSEPKKSILSSKSFGKLQTTKEALSEALASHCARAWDKLRQQQHQVVYLSVFLRTNPFRRDLPQYSRSSGVRLIHPTDDLCHITTIAKHCLAHIFLPGYQYHKTGVLLVELVDKRFQQNDLFNPICPETQQKRDKLMQVTGKIKQRYGRHSLYLAAQGSRQPAWQMRANLCSPKYTTSWADLPLVKA
ncbi:Y-family DNA polymerase [Legionella sp. W05-934-2]|uniref:Y-family DNA polymerase n=1 Tax=Legionella sp. W05-934-2 TaxID=1198649 RepID=UPI0034635D3E